MPTLGNYEVELKDGYVVSARDDSGSAWSSDAVVEYQFSDDGYLIFARYADGTVWIADASPDVSAAVSSLRAELEGGPKLPAVGEALGRGRNVVVRATNKAVFGSRDLFRKASPSGQPVFRPSPTPRVVSHLMVLGAVVVPMSFTVASAQTSAMPQPRVTIPLKLDAAATDTATADALHQAATSAELDLVPQPPAAALNDGNPQPPPPTPRPFARAQPVPGSGGLYSWGWCTWYLSTRRYVPWTGNAIQWFNNARALGFPEGQTPKVGAIMVTRESWWGHVAYVESVDDNGGFTVSEMNYKGFGVVDERHFNAVPSFVIGFIY